MFKIPQNKTKIIATIGPASGDKKILSKMIDVGLDVVRFNFSHGEHDTFDEWTKNIREINKKRNLNIKIMQDLQGPRIRIGESLPKKGINLKEGEIIKLGFGKYKKGFLPIDYKNIVKDVRVGNSILLVDGLIELKIIAKKKSFLIAKVTQGGRVFPRKGVNIPGAHLSTPSLTKKDLEDIKWGIKNKVDFMCLSFVRTANDIKDLENVILKKDKESQIKLVAKIEKPQAVKNINSILKATDLIMVARGDLGIEVKLEKLPEIQKEIILKSKKYKKPVIVATQMMESMTNNPVPTRAEVSDVANAVFDGADFVMLSGETTVGKYPIKTVQMVEKVLRESEKEMRKFSLKNFFIKK